MVLQLDYFGKNMKTTTNSIWTKFLNKEYNDPFSIYKDNVSYQLELLILSVENELLSKEPSYTKEVARKMSICMVMEQMLAIQYEYTPQSMEAMTIALLTDLPKLKDFRHELVLGKKSKTFFQRLCFWK